MEAFTDITFFFVKSGPFDSKVNTCKYLILLSKGDGKEERTRENGRREEGKGGEGSGGEGRGGEERK